MFSRIQTHLKTNLGDFYDRALLCLLLVSFILRIAWLDVPAGSLIFDEWYYVNVARNILGIPQSLGGGGIPPYQNAIIGVDPNHEHPPLAKLMIALSTWLFGNNGYGFRLPSVIFGTLSILVFYLLLKELSRNNSLSFLASFLFSFDNLIFVHSRIATLDIFGLFFMILGFYLYFRKKMALSGVAFALSVLCKFGGLFGIFAVIAYHIGKILFSKRFAMC